MGTAWISPALSLDGAKHCAGSRCLISGKEKAIRSIQQVAVFPQPQRVPGAAGQLVSRSVSQDANLQGQVSPIRGLGLLYPESQLTYSAPGHSTWGFWDPRRSPGLVSFSPCGTTPTNPLLGAPGGSHDSSREGPPPAGLSLKITEREISGNLGDCSNREGNMNISLRWFKLLNNITKPSVLAGI